MGAQMKLVYGFPVTYLSDEFSQSVFFECVNRLSENCDYAYIDSFCLLELLEQEFETDTVVIGIKDNITVLKFKQITNTIVGMSDGEYILYRLAQQHPTKTFVIFIDHFNAANSMLAQHASNVKFVYWPPIIDDKANYQACAAVTDKNFNSQQHVVCLNRHMRMHRIMTLGYLVGIGLTPYIYMSAVKLATVTAQTNDIMELVDWNFSANTYQARDIAQHGFKQICADHNIVHVNQEPYQMLDQTQTVLHWSNGLNFENNLSKIYKNSFLEIVTETLFEDPHGFGTLTEKYLNTVYGYNFPIILGTPGVVAHARDLGFDLFDDVVDHSYDQITDPLNRIQAAINLNLELITNKPATIEKWIMCRARFDKNFVYANQAIYNISRTNMIQEFDRCVGQG
jgi:hypothetical protein